MTKELAASAPSAMRTKVVAPPDNIILTVGANTLPPRGSVVLAEDQRAPRRQHLHCRRRTLPCAEALFHQTSCCAATGGLAVGPAAQDTPGGIKRMLRVVGEPRKPRSHTVRSGQEPQTQGGTASLLRVGDKPWENLGPNAPERLRGEDHLCAAPDTPPWSTWRPRPWWNADTPGHGLECLLRNVGSSTAGRSARCGVVRKSRRPSWSRTTRSCAYAPCLRTRSSQSCSAA